MDRRQDGLAVSDSDPTRYIERALEDAYDSDPVAADIVKEFLADIAEYGFQRGVTMWAGIVAAEVTAAHARIAELERRGAGLRWCGPWTSGAAYTAGDVCQHRGSGWVCEVDGTREAPGGTAAGWGLLAKQGRDGTRGAK